MTGQTLLATVARAFNLELTEITGEEECLAEFLEYCNQAIRDLEEFSRWYWLDRTGSVTTSADVESVNLPADFKSFQESAQPYYGNGSGKLRAESSAWLHRQRAGGITRGLPQRFALEADPGTGLYRLSLWPTPDAAYVIVLPYRRMVARLTAATDAVMIPAAFEDVLKQLAICNTEEGHEKIGRSQFRDKAEAMLAQAARSPVEGQQRIALRPVIGRSRRELAEESGLIAVEVAAPLEPDE